MKNEPLSKRQIDTNFAIDLSKTYGELHADSGKQQRGAAGEGPLYDHDCTRCRFLGRYDWTGDTYDLYFCQQTSFPTVIARYGDEGWEYTSGMESDHPALAEARQRAEKAGLL